MRAVLDTNTIVSWVLTPRGASRRLREHWQAGAFELLLSDAIVAEYRRAVSYRRVRERAQLSAADVDELAAGMQQFGLQVDPTERLEVVPQDPDDDKFFECAVAGGAAYIVSRDRSVLAVKVYRGIRVVTPETFLALIES